MHNPVQAKPIASLILVAIAVTTLVALALFFSGAYNGNVVDDALISFRYAQNLADGNGLVFNPGERVEGYTNFLWTFTLAGIYALAGDPQTFLPIAVGASITCAAIAVVLTWWIGRRLWGNAALPTALALGLVVLDNAYGVWAMQALEGHFLVCWMLLVLCLAEAKPRRWPIFVGIAVAAMQMTRPDAFLLPLAVGASELVEVARRKWRGEEGAGALLRGWLVAAGVAAVVYGVYFAWRYDYYGWLLPNTFYLKVGGSSFDAWSRGIAYVGSYLAERGWVPLLALFALPLVRTTLVRSVLLFVLLHAAYVASVGGDFYPGHRFLLVLTPMVALLAGSAAHGLGRLVDRLPRFARIAHGATWAAAVGAVAVVAILGLRHGPWEHEIRRWANHVQRTRQFSEWLRDQKAPGATMVVGDIGAAGFYANIPVIDIYGIVDTTVAHMEVASLGRGKPGHEKVAPRSYLLGKNPTYIKQGYVSGDLHREGYYLSGEVPAAISGDWLWVRDDLPKTGSFLAQTAFSFERRDPAWEGEGEVARWFGARTQPGQHAVTGQNGLFLNTFHARRGDDATGTLRSPPFQLVGDRMILRVGGGNDAENLRVSLLVDGARVHSETGHDTEVLTRRVWEIARFRGRDAVLEVVDTKEGGWGHLLVDEVVQWRAHAPTTTASD